MYFEDIKRGLTLEIPPTVIKKESRLGGTPFFILQIPSLRCHT